MTYHLLDHVNRLNAAELAKPRDARTNMTPGWAPPSEVVFATKPVDGFVRANMARPFPRTHSLGRGDKIRCGMPLLPGQHIHTRQLDSKHYNVCRPFNEAHAHPESRSLVEHLDALVNERVLGRTDDAASFFGMPASFSTHATQPNHGHGAVCGCVKEISLRGLKIPPAHGMLMHDGETYRILDISVDEGKAECAKIGCSECKGVEPFSVETGRIICDDERAGRVSPSHAVGGYVEWQRPSSVVGHVASQVPPELAGIYATDGDPATTERRR